ncbi:MAG: hypothetical protein B0A82_05600 [Alkalinema sp. CACIAM 70d]|nr:MAG: hypothetical protein B0A82_05600 [Alkalinema sp. CACIAM 70d]
MAESPYTSSRKNMGQSASNAQHRTAQHTVAQQQCLTQAQQCLSTQAQYAGSANHYDSAPNDELA